METTILLSHQNYYFRQGIEHLLRQWFHSQEQSVCILHTAKTIAKFDIIFAAATQHSAIGWRQLQRIRHRPLFFLLVDHKNILCCGYEDGQISMTDKPETLFALLETFVRNQHPMRPPVLPRLYGIVHCLSPREREVLWGYKHGMDNHQISLKSGMSIKAISAYRNHAMQKLLLKNHADLHYWLHSIAAENLESYFRKRNVFSDKEKCRGRAIVQKNE